MYDLAAIEDPSFFVLQHTAWYRVDTLLELVKALRRINFSIAEQRNQALQRINTAACPPPFSAHSRFPTIPHVCEGYGDWGRKLTQLRLALSHKSRDKDKSLRDSAPATDISDAIVAFTSGLQAIVDQCIVGDGVLTRTTFERLSLSLSWVD